MITFIPFPPCLLTSFYTLVHQIKWLGNDKLSLPFRDQRVCSIAQMNSTKCGSMDTIRLSETDSCNFIELYSKGFYYSVTMLTLYKRFQWSVAAIPQQFSHPSSCIFSKWYMKVISFFYFDTLFQVTLQQNSRIFRTSTFILWWQCIQRIISFSLRCWNLCSLLPSSELFVGKLDDVIINPRLLLFHFVHIHVINPYGTFPRSSSIICFFADLVKKKDIFKVIWSLF